MKHTIFDYALTDRFIMMFLTASGEHLEKLEAFNTVPASMFDLEAVGDDSWMGTPSIITASGVTLNLTDDGELDGHPGVEPTHSFSAKTFSMIWALPTDEDRPMVVKHRNDGPALIEFKDFSVYHTKDRRMGFRIGAWKFAWYQNGTMVRHAGPYAINGDLVTMMLDSNGMLRSASKVHCQFGWDHPGGGNLISAAINLAITENQIEVNRLDPGPSVFANEMEQAIFYATVAA